MTRLLRHMVQLAIAAIAAVLTLATAATTRAAAPVVSLNLGTGQGKRQLACAHGSKPDPYTVFTRGTRVVIVGSVRPKPTARSWRVTVTISRCARGRFHRSSKRVLIGRPNGSFRVVYAARAPGLYYARADYASFHTGKHRFVVR